MTKPEHMHWKLFYYWMLEGKWRRWCIPGAFFSMVGVWLIPTILRLAFKDSPTVDLILRSFFNITLWPVRFIYNIDFLVETKIVIYIIFAWYALLGAIAGAIVGFLWNLIKRKPQSENCYILENEKVEHDTIRGNNYE